WGRRTYANGPFSASRNPEGVGPAKVVRKAIEENKLGKRIFMPLPINYHTHELLRADAEIIPIGRVPWLDRLTSKRMGHPPYFAGFLLHEDPARRPSALRKRIAELEAENAALKVRLAEPKLKIVKE